MAVLDNKAREPATADLSILIRVSELGTFSAVANERDVPVSQISRAVDRLERDFKVKLVNRSTHGLSMTTEGEMFLAHSRRVVDALADLSTELDTRSGSPTGVVKLSVSPVMGDRQIIPSLVVLAAKHPRLRIDVIADDKMVDLATEGIDLAVRTNVVDNDNLIARPVGEHGRALYASPGYLKTYGAPDHPDQLSQHRCVTHAVSHILNRWPFRHGRKIREQPVEGFFRTNNGALILTMALQGVGIARLNTTIAGPLCDSGELVPVLDEFRDPTRVPIYLVMMPNRHRLPKTRACADHLARLYKRLEAY